MTYSSINSKAEGAFLLPQGRIYAGDCVSHMASMPSASVDLIVTDPPYLVDYQDRLGRSIAGDKHGHWLEPAFAEMYRLLKNDSYCISFFGYHVVDKFMNAWRGAGFTPVGQFIWHKPYASSKRHTALCHEAAYLLAKGNPQPPEVPLSSILPWSYSGNNLHPTEKAVAILEPLIEKYSKPQDLVLDPFCGSGSSLVAAVQTGRNAIGIDVSRKHALTGKRRLYSYLHD